MLNPVRHVATPGPRVAVTMLFLVTGLIAGTWIGRIPAVTSNLELDTGNIGSLLLFFSFGSLVAFQFIGKMIVRNGSQGSIRRTGYLMSASLCLLALAPNPASLGVGLFVVGFAVGSTSVAMNAQGVSVQRLAGRPIMNTLHGFFTLGLLIGSALGSLAAEAGVRPLPHFVGFSLAGLLIVTIAVPGLIPDEPVRQADEPRAGLVFPPRALWPLGIAAFCAGLGEGSMYDWSALYIHDEMGASESAGALGFATFSTSMLVGRFSGDRIVARLGMVNVIRAGSLVAAAGLLAGLVVDSLFAVFIGFALLGLGLSVLMPLFYSAAGTHPGIPGVRGVASIATMGFTGLLVGPPILGTIAESTSLRAALGVVVVLGVIMALLAGRIAPAATAPEINRIVDVSSQHAG